MLTQEQIDESLEYINKVCNANQKLYTGVMSELHNIKMKISKLNFNIGEIMEYLEIQNCDDVDSSDED